ncbi:hypothetical protein WG66_011418, partial [Moniliophthora roreri]
MEMCHMFRQHTSAAKTIDASHVNPSAGDDSTLLKDIPASSREMTLVMFTIVYGQINKASHATSSNLRHKNRVGDPWPAAPLISILDSSTASELCSLCVVLGLPIINS